MAETTTETKTEETTTILATKEAEKPAPETKLFQSEADKENAVQAAKEAAIQELAEKQAQEEASKKAAELEAKKAEEEKTKTNETTPKTPDKENSTSQKDYTLNLPENSVLTREDLEGLTKKAKESSLTQEQAQKLVQEQDAFGKAAQSRLMKQQDEQLKSLRVQWQESVKKDPELGGENLPQTAIKSSRAAKAIFDADTLKFLNETGYGDHPGLVRAMIKVYDLIGEDKFIKGTTGARPSGPMTAEEKAKKLFGNPISEAVGAPK